MAVTKKYCVWFKTVRINYKKIYSNNNNIIRTTDKSLWNNSYPAFEGLNPLPQPRTVRRLPTLMENRFVISSRLGAGFRSSNPPQTKNLDEPRLCTPFRGGGGFGPGSPRRNFDTYRTQRTHVHSTIWQNIVCQSLNTKLLFCRIRAVLGIRNSINL